MERNVEHNQPLHARIRLARRAQGLTQEQLAEEVGASRHSVMRWESGTNSPEPEHRERLAGVLGGTPADYTRAQWERVIPSMVADLRRQAAEDESDAIEARLQRLEARVSDLEQRRLRDLAERVIEARNDPARRDDLVRAALALAEALAGRAQEEEEEDLLELLRKDLEERLAERMRADAE